MGWLSDIFDFEKNKLGNMLGKYKKDPERLFLGINTPLESKLWGGLLGKNYTPTVDMWGGSTPDDVATARARGINTGPGETMQNVARAVTSAFVGGYALGGSPAAGAGQGLGSAAGEGGLGGLGSGLGSAAGEGGLGSGLQLGGSGLGLKVPAFNAAPGMGGSGLTYGGLSEGGAFSAAELGTGGSSYSWADVAQQIGDAMGKGRRRRPEQQSYIPPAPSLPAPVVVGGPGAAQDATARYWLERAAQLRQMASDALAPGGGPMTY